MRLIGLPVALSASVLRRSRQAHSHLSLAFASVMVCHCMLLGLSGPPRFSAMIWSTT